MKKVLTFNGSPRSSSNSSILLEHFTKGIDTRGAVTRSVSVKDLALKY